MPTLALSRLMNRRGMRSVLRGTSRYFFGKRGTRRIHGFRLFYRMRMDALVRSRTEFHKAVRRTEVRFWVDGKDAFRRIEKCIMRAKHSIAIEMFIWKDDYTGRRIAALLTQAADRGVIVDITKEEVGDFFELAHDFASTKGGTNPIWEKFWNHPGIHVHQVTDDNHTKAYVFDGEILLLSGMNIADEYRYSWHDYLVELRGTRFAQAFLMREHMGERSSSVELVLNRREKKELRMVVEDLLHQAQKSIVIEMAYFSDPAIIDLVAERSTQDIRVTVVLPASPDLHKNANKQGIERLMKQGNPRRIQILEYPGILHGKLLLIDKVTALVGSMNFMTSSLDHMGEANVLIRHGHPWVLQKIRTMIRGDIAKSTLVKKIPRLGWLGRWLAWMGL